MIITKRLTILWFIPVLSIVCVGLFFTSQLGVGLAYAQESWADVWQSNEITNISVVSLAFIGDKFHPVLSDVNGNAYPTPQWQDNTVPPNGTAADKGDVDCPACYERTAKIKVNLKLIITPVRNYGNLPTNNILVKGTGPDLSSNGSHTFLTFSPKHVTRTSSIIRIANYEADNAFENKIRLFNPMAITWQISLDNGTSWHPAGTTTNQIYVIRINHVLTTPNNNILFHTALHISTDGAQNAADSNNVQNVIDAIWAKFATLNLPRQQAPNGAAPWAAGQTTNLTYYHNWTFNGASSVTPSYGTTTNQLMKLGDGNCFAWTSFLFTAMAIQGVQCRGATGDATGAWEDLTCSYTAPGGGGLCDTFLVKNWSGFPNPPVITIMYTDAYNLPLISAGATAYNFVAPAITRGVGVNGQGNNSNPESLFVNHQLAVINGTWYDPSYGVTRPNKLPDVNAAMDGFARLAIFRGQTIYQIWQNFPAAALAMKQVAVPR